MGRIEVICGSMFSGKTEELIRRLERLKYANQIYQVFKPLVDTRNKKNTIESHSKIEIKAQTVANAKEILDSSNNLDVIGIDEAQFFSEDLVDVCNTLANRGTRVIVAGLDMDFSGKPFGPMPNLMAIAEEVTKVHAVCSKTGDPALYSYRRGGDNNVVLLGEKDKYEPLSRKAFISKMKNK
jgi:thymidine kinase